MPRGTTIDELYVAIGTVITRATGRLFWRKGGIQSMPEGPYATAFISEGVGRIPDVVENIEGVQADGGSFQQVVWGSKFLNIEVDFLRSGNNDKAMQAAMRFSNSLYLEARMYDLWLISGFCGQIRTIDISSIFRADTEPRAQVKFNLYANVTELPLNDTSLQEIDSQHINVEHDGLDGTRTHVDVDIHNTNGG